MRALRELTSVKPAEWFRKRELTEWLTAYDEPFVHDYLRANMYLVRGRDIDLLVDTGMGVLRLSEIIARTPASRCWRWPRTSMSTTSARCTSSPTAPGRPQRRRLRNHAGARHLCRCFAALAEPVSRLPASDWNVDD